MDPRARADALLARASARGAFVVTPDNATSPMDSANTQQIPRSVVAEIDRSSDPDTTTQLPASLIAENDHPLAGAEPTTRLDLPPARGEGSTQPQPYPRRPGAPQQTRPLPQATTPLTRRPPAAPVQSPLIEQPEPETVENEVGGLVPTVKQNPSGRSNLSRRLDGI
ncbi:hypothetical protein SAMN04489729_3830 [Amycolatopsis lurida]|uniref:Uncharacterized protein n=1 Tax=Amycolatopsis lurida NRRL 2430 TaxID=1460371 RepID=A0A2P2G2W9_AMYLU|nr:hypothetical protein [Amycolatopsis lurida]KFU83321.1 hypothetical protein BB31_02135 [Amycolatopsis lurida NRRL 2430]SED25463.1 hypothetical protein SAMN04489729_3830 [Amycolatopsis lurida]